MRREFIRRGNSASFSAIRAVRLGAAAVALLGSPAMAFAANGDAELDALDEASVPGAAEATARSAGTDIVVTAQRRETRLQETPVTVNAFGADALAEQGFRRVGDLAGLAAGVQIPDASLGTQAVFVRGIGTSRSIGNPSVGIYIDDVYIPRSFGAGWYGSLPDIDRIEILHGPQGTLYGQNTSAGALKFISRTPTDQTLASAEIGIGSRDGFELRGYLAGQIAPNLTASIAGTHLRQDGADYNVTLRRDVARLSNDQARLILHFTPGELKATLSADYLRDRSDYRVANPRNVTDWAVRRTFSDIDPRQSYDGGGATLRLEHPLGDALTLRSISAYREFKMELPTDSDGKQGYISGFVQNLDQYQLSEELQLSGDFGRLNFTIGALGFREVFDVHRLSWTNDAFSIIDSSSATTSFGLYAQGDYKLTDALTATLGLRLSHERKELDASGNRSNVNGDYLAQSFSVEGLSKNYTSIVPKIGLSYKFTPAILAYASYSQGLTSGGFNPAPGNANVARIPIGEEEVTAYETGLKTEFLDGRLRVNLAAYYNDYSGYQGSITNPVIDGQIVTGAVIQNAGDAHIYGVEFELAARPTPRLDASLSISALHSEFDSYLNPTGADASDYVGEALPNAPEFTVGARIGYNVPLGDGSRLRFGASVQHQSSSYFGIDTTRELTKYPRTTYVDGDIAYTTPSGRLTLSLNAKNLLDKTYALPVASGYSPARGLDGVVYNTPRTIWFRIKVGI